MHAVAGFENNLNTRFNKKCRSGPDVNGTINGVRGFVDRPPAFNRTGRDDDLCVGKCCGQ